MKYVASLYDRNILKIRNIKLLHTVQKKYGTDKIGTSV